MQYSYNNIFKIILGDFILSKNVLITGASRGIGKKISEEFIKLNYNVAINSDKSFLELNKLKNKMLSINKNIISICADVSDYNQCVYMFDEIKKKFGEVDILINNAGISYWGLFNEMQARDWNKVLRINLESVINCSHIAVQNMIKKKSGVIINISSVWGNVGASCEVIYSTSKGAVNLFTKALAKELAPSKININAIACGVIDTNMNNNLSKEEKNNLKEQIPIGRFGSCEDVADLVLFLSSDKAKYITGQVINLDGGWI
jgi:3-oxoacyl-[acyl-carrier protein] reductase